MSTIRGYNLSRTCTWTPAAAGSYILLVWAREVGSLRGYDLTGSVAYTVR